MSTDVVVIGAGWNGLATAALLAAKGSKVVVLERRDRAGGLGSREELAPGYTVPGLVHEPLRVHPRAVEELGLTGHGLRLATEAPSYLAAGEEGGSGLVLSGDPAQIAREIGPRSVKDAERAGEYGAFVERARRAIEPVFQDGLPSVVGDEIAHPFQLLKTAFGLRRLGSDEMLELLRVVPMCAADWTQELFETPQLQAALSLPACRGSLNGPWAPATAGQLLLAECAGTTFVQGSPASLTDALVAAARAKGVELRLGEGAAAIDVQEGRVRAVRTETGERIECRTVASSADPRATMLGLVGPRRLAPRERAEMQHYRCRGTTGYVHLALNRKLTYRARPGESFLRAILAWDLDVMEQAFDAVKYRRSSARPVLSVHVPTVADPSLAPGGHHVVSIEAHAAPFDVEGGWTDASREALGDTVVAELMRHTDLEKDAIVARRVVSPRDLEDEWGLTGGHVLHGEPSLDQLFFMRPTAACGQHRTPIGGLHLCGRGTHPGPYLHLGPAVFAAERITSR